MSRGNVLIVSNTEDAHAVAVSSRLRERAIAVHRLDSDEFASEGHTWHIASGGESRSSWHIPCIRTVWYRKVIFPEETDATQSFVRQELEGLFDSVLDEYRDCRWVNRRDCIAHARPKVAQLREASRVGLQVPDTIVTSSVDILETFAETHGNQIVAKPMRAQVVRTADQSLVIGTRHLTAEHFASAVAFSPCYAQERLVLSSEVRAIVFGNQFFSFRLTPQEKADDLKQLPIRKIRHEYCELDAVTARKVLALMSFYGLEFGAVDFGIVGDREPIFLELNPNGQWLWLQLVTGVNLIDPFIDLLRA